MMRKMMKEIQTTNDRRRLNMFSDSPTDLGFAVNAQALTVVDGLSYKAEWLSPREEQELTETIDTAAWSTELARRVQHYGYQYDYKARRVDSSMRLGELPNWLLPWAQRLVDQGFFSSPPDQVIVNEYQPGQGISPHIDCQPCFGDVVASLSLHSGCIMDFTRTGDPRRVPVWLAACSLIVLQGPARYAWKHGIVKRQRDTIAGQTILRGKRISLTFRHVRP
jgi:alkylated DNA repair dioxygenase AlkB